VEQPQGRRGARVLPGGDEPEGAEGDHARQKGRPDNPDHAGHFPSLSDGWVMGDRTPAHPWGTGPAARVTRRARGHFFGGGGERSSKRSKQTSTSGTPASPPFLARMPIREGAFSPQGLSPWTSNFLPSVLLAYS